MKELYLLSLVGNIKIALVVFSSFGFVAWIAILAARYINYAYGDDDLPKSVKKWERAFVIIGLVCTLLAIPIPSQKELYVIYGIGGTIDYIRNDSIANQLPDKCIRAIDVYLDKYVDDPKKQIKETTEEDTETVTKII